MKWGKISPMRDKLGLYIDTTTQGNRIDQNQIKENCL